jgi:hypothetical protein
MPAAGGNRARAQANARNNYTKRRQKIIPKRKKTATQKRELPKAVRLGNQQRKALAKIQRNMRGLRPIRSVGTGIDYEYVFQLGGQRRKFTIDLKFSYGELGDRTIKIRANRRRLINDAQWAFVIDRKGRIEIFHIRELERFVRQNWGSISKDRAIHKVGYVELPVRLDELYAQRGLEPIRTTLSQNGIGGALKTLKEKYREEPKKSNGSGPPRQPVKTGRPAQLDARKTMRATKGIRPQARGR